MYKNLFLVCLIVAASSSDYFITPSNPPTAYQNQFYSVRFRVRGLDDPKFTFQGLPKSLSGSSDGVISGIPTQAGSVSIVINYQSGSQKGSKQVILKTLEDYRKTQSIVSATKTKIGLVIQYPGNLIFRVGQSFSIPLVVRNSVGSLIWAFHGLPTGIKGSSKEGTIQGQVSQAGYYNIQVECGDEEGKSGQAFLTVNIQPKASLTTTQVVEVASKFTSSLSSTTFDKIQAQQVAADNQLFKALNIVDTKKKIVADVKGHVAVNTVRVNNAQASFNAAEAAWKQAISDKEVAQALLSSAQSALDAAQKNLDLALTEQGQATTRLAEARKAVEQAQKRFNNAQKSVEQAEDNLVSCKDKMQKAEANLRDAKTQKASAEEEYKRAFDALQAARTQLQDAKARKQRADQAVKAAKDALQLAQQARDDAQNDLKLADFNLQKAEKQLDEALKKVAAIRQKYNAAEKEYSTAKWEWEFVINKLYVAQARKEAADRASAIALAEGSLSDHNGDFSSKSIGGSVNLGTSAGSSGSGSSSNSISFGGCDARSYPIISGTSKVVAVSNNGYSLASGHNVVFGSCSNVSNCAVGDFISYNGYFVNGVVNALRIERVLTS